MDGKERQIKRPISTSFHWQIKRTIDSYRKGARLGKKETDEIKEWGEKRKEEMNLVPQARA